MVNQYLSTACNIFTNRGLLSPHPAQVNFMLIILTTLKNYKSVPNWHNMITDKMTLWMLSHVSTLPLDHAHVAIFNWVILGRYKGFWASK